MFWRLFPIQLWRPASGKVLSQTTVPFSQGPADHSSFIGLLLYLFSKFILALGLPAVPLPLCKCGSILLKYIYTYIYKNSLILTFILKFHISFDGITFFREILCLWFSTSSAKQRRDLGKTGLFNLVSRAHTKGNCVGQSSSTGMNLSPSQKPNLAFCSPKGQAWSEIALQLSFRACRISFLSSLSNKTLNLSRLL